METSTGIHEVNSGTNGSIFTEDFRETFGLDDDESQTAEDGFQSSIHQFNEDGLDADEQEDVKGVITALDSLDKVKDDKGHEIQFTAEIKSNIENALSKALVSYRRVGKTLYRVCKDIFDLNNATSPHRLFRFSLGIAKIPERTAYLHLRIYKEFADNIAAYTLGVRKLDVISGLETPLAFLEQHGIEALVDMASGEVTKLVKAVAGKKDGKTSQAPVNRQYGPFKFSEAANGKSFTVHCKNAYELRKIMDVVESHLQSLANPTNGASSTVKDDEPHSEEPNPQEQEHPPTDPDDGEHHIHEEDSEDGSETAHFEETDDSTISKPPQVILISTYSDGREIISTLYGKDVPDKEDWEEFADELNNKSERAGELLTTIRMEDESTGKSYLHEITFDNNIAE